jgi:hypothetical protein
VVQGAEADTARLLLAEPEQLVKETTAALAETLLHQITLAAAAVAQAQLAVLALAVRLRVVLAVQALNGLTGLTTLAAAVALEQVMLREALAAAEGAALFLMEQNYRVLPTQVVAVVVAVVAELLVMVVPVLLLFDTKGRKRVQAAQLHPQVVTPTTPSLRPAHSRHKEKTWHILQK